MSNKPSVSVYGDISVDEIVKAIGLLYPDKKIRINDDRGKDNSLLHPIKIGITTTITATTTTLTIMITITKYYY